LRQPFEGTAQVQRLVITRMRACTYLERFAEAAEIATQAVNRLAANGASSNGASQEVTRTPV
jgi:hypothetical protein